MTHTPAQHPQGGGVAQAIVRPQGGAAVGTQVAVLFQNGHRIGQGIKPAAGGDGAHHVHVALEDEQRLALPARRGGAVRHHVARLIPHGEEAQAGQKRHIILPRGPLMAGGVGVAGQGAEGVDHPGGDVRPGTERMG